MNTATMDRTVTLTRIGNSQGIIIPRPICKLMGLHVGDTVTLEVDEGGKRLTVESAQAWTLEALMADYEGPAPSEYDWGDPMGKEMW